jgi:hypothetical protein
MSFFAAGEQVPLLDESLCHVSWTRPDRWRASLLYAHALKQGMCEKDALQHVYKLIIQEQCHGYSYFCAS